MELFTLKDFTDDGGYLKNPEWCVGHANKKVEKMQAEMWAIIEDLAAPNRMSETEGTLLSKFGKLRERARDVLAGK